MRLKLSIGNIIVIVLLALLISVAAYRFSGHVTPLLTVKSGSMKPTLMIGDVILIEPVKPEDIRVGDVIVFHNPWTGRLIVHRVVQKTSEGVYTKGDANPGIDPWSPIPYNLVVGKWTGFKIPYWLGIGYLSLFLSGEIYLKIPYWLGIGYLSLFLSGEIYPPYGQLLLLMLLAANILLFMRDLLRRARRVRVEDNKIASSQEYGEDSRSE